MFSRLYMAAMLIPLVCFAAPLYAEAPLDRAPEDDEVDYAPYDGEVIGTNPPAFVWLPHEGVESWRVQYSQSAEFDAPETVTVTGLDMTVHVPMETLSSGEWRWRYGYVDEDGETVYSESRSFVIPADAIEFPFLDIGDAVNAIPDTRPRTYVTPDDMAAIRANEDGAYNWLIDPAVEAAEAALARDEALFEEPKPWGDYGDDWREVYNETWRSMRPYTRGMEACARAYLFTGDERFAEEAKRRLIHFMTWDVDGPSSAYWPTELGMDIAEHAPRTFDWIYDTLTPEEREKCVEVLGKRIRQINEMHRGRPFEARPFSSHPGRMIGFAVEGGIVLAHEVEDAPEWLEYTLRVLWSVYPAWGGHDGGWHEGVSYWSSYMRRMLQIVAELDRLGIPLKDKPFFQNTGDFGLYAVYPNRPTRAFGDGYESSVGVAQGNLMYTLASLYENPYYRWHAEESNGGPSGPEAFHVWRPNLDAAAPADLPQSRSFEDVGWVAMHSGMADPADNVLLLFQSSPYGAISHNHANQNAFVIEAYGEPLAISSGYYQNYGSPHHSEWVWHTKAHNAILADGEGQVIRSPGSRGRILEHRADEDWSYALGDATEAYGGRLEQALRHIVFLRPQGSAVIVDELKTPEEPASFQWLLHARDEMALFEEEQRLTVTQGGAAMDVQFLAPAGMSFEQTSGWDPEPCRPDAAPPQYHFTASTVEPARQTRIVTVLMPRHADESGASPEDVALLDAEGGVAVRIGGATVLVRDDGAAEVRAGAYSTRSRAAVFR